MFYPVESLKRGRRFYLCWVADSWPLRFATITHRQLWSQDIRRICDDLLEVMTNESGRPANRFSLRLSSQLLRGVARLYQRKVTVFLGDLWTINANVIKNVNKKWYISEDVVVDVQQPLLLLSAAQLVPQEEPENEQRIKEIIQNSENVVGNIEEITLKETTIPEFLLPPDDGFGEENPEQALQLLKDQTIEMMLVQDKSIHHSGLDVALDVTDKSQDKSRLVTHNVQMEPISELDAAMFRKSVGDDRLTMGDLEEDIPEIPEIQLPAPDLPVPPPEPELQTVEEPQVEPAVVPETRPVEEPTNRNQTVEIQLEELEEPQVRKRRLKNKLIIDKKIKVTGDYLVTRIENPHVELRCEDSVDDIVDLRVPVDILFRRPSRAGIRLQSNISMDLTRMYQKNLAVVAKQSRPHTEMEEVAAKRTSRFQTTPMLERIKEEPPIIPEEQPMPVIDMSLTYVVEPQNVTLPIEQAKRPRLSGYVSCRQSQLTMETSASINEVDMENIPGAANIRTPPPAQVPSIRRSQRFESQDTNVRTVDTAEESLSVMLEEAGLADLPNKNVEEEIPQASTSSSQMVTRRRGSKISETMLGSLDRTEVSLGDQTTDSKRFIREQWGTESTMMEILRSIKAGQSPVTVRSLIAKGPVMAGYKKIMAARCFTSILKLRQHGFIVIEKDPKTSEVKDILLGPVFNIK